MILLNFSHPLTPEQMAQVEAQFVPLTAGLTGDKEREKGEMKVEVRDIPVHFDNGQPFVPQVEALAEVCGLSPTEWQTRPLIVNPPALNFIAVALLAELHGRMGYFPSVLRLRPIPDSNPPQFEVAEIINLQAVRDRAREKR